MNECCPQTVVVVKLTRIYDCLFYIKFEEYIVYKKKKSLFKHISYIGYVIWINFYELSSYLHIITYFLYIHVQE